MSLYLIKHYCYQILPCFSVLHLQIRFGLRQIRPTASKTLLMAKKNKVKRKFSLRHGCRLKTFLIISKISVALWFFFHFKFHPFTKVFLSRKYRNQNLVQSTSIWFFTYTCQIWTFFSINNIFRDNKSQKKRDGNLQHFHSEREHWDQVGYTYNNKTTFPRILISFPSCLALHIWRVWAEVMFCQL